MKTDYNDEIFSEIVTPDYPTDPLELLGERSFNEPRIVPPEEIGTPVQEFFRDATLFITGATGFIGCVLLEKLLRSCPHIKRIYVMIRPKKGKSPQERLEQMFKDRLYKRLKYEVPEFMKKLALIMGDLEQRDFGLSEEDRKLLAEEVNIIYHCGANVRFDEKLADAVRNKVISTQDILKLARSCKKLKSIVYVSTAYAFCTGEFVEEKVVPMPAHYKDIMKTISAASEEELLLRESELLMGWPNTYTFCKALTESMLKEEANDLPMGIFRPSIVLLSYREPIKGWANNFNGPIGMIAACRTGVLHVGLDKPENPMLNTVPVDLTVNSLICATKDISEMYSNKKSREHEIPVYNFTNPPENTPSWGFLQIHDINAVWEWPSIKTMWYYSAVFTESKILFLVYSFFLHLIPGCIMDAIIICSGHKPFLVSTYKKLFLSVLVKLGFFIQRRWKFETTRVRNLWNHLSPKDREIFFFDLYAISWEEYCRSGTLGMRVYVLKDDIHTLPKARKHYRRLYYAHIILKYSFYGLVLILLSKLFHNVF